jgi:hypothetical protein
MQLIDNSTFLQIQHPKKCHYIRWKVSNKRESQKKKFCIWTNPNAKKSNTFSLKHPHQQNLVAWNQKKEK